MRASDLEVQKKKKKRRRKSEGRDSDGSEKKIIERKKRRGEKEAETLWAMDKIGKKGNRGDGKEM